MQRCGKLPQLSIVITVGGGPEAGIRIFCKRKSATSEHQLSCAAGCQTLQKEGQKTVTPSRCCSWVLRLLATLRFSSPSDPESSEGRLEAFSTRRSFRFILLHRRSKHFHGDSILLVRYFPRNEGVCDQVSVVVRSTNQRHCRSGWSGRLLITLAMHTHQRHAGQWACPCPCPPYSLSITKRRKCSKLHIP